MGLRWRLWRAGAALVGVTVAAGLAAETAGAQDRAWTANGDGREVVATDCTDCGDDIGMMITCDARGGSPTVTIPWVALEKGRQGNQAQVTISIGGSAFRYNARMRLEGLVGFVPEFRIAPNDPLIAALKGGRSARVAFSGRSNTIALSGAGPALDRFLQNCFGTASARPAAPPQPPPQPQPQPPSANPPQPGPAQPDQVQPGQFVTILLRNALTENVDYYSRDAAGQPQYVATLSPGQTVEQPSIPGVVLIFGVNGQPVGEYVTTASAQQAHDVGAVAGGQPAIPPQPGAGAAPPGPAAQPVAPPQDQDPAVWTTSRIGQTLTAMFGIPQTDATSVAIHCTPGQSASRIQFLSAPQARPGARGELVVSGAGRAVRVGVAADAQGFLAASLVGAGAGELLVVLLGRDWVEVTAGGAPAGRFLGLGAAREGVDFVTACGGLGG